MNRPEIKVSPEIEEVIEYWKKMAKYADYLENVIYKDSNLPKHIVSKCDDANISKQDVTDCIYQICGKYGTDREDIKSDLRKLCEHLLK